MMTQSRISSFFNRGIAEADYHSQVEQSSVEQGAAMQEAAILRNERRAQSDHANSRTRSRMMMMSTWRRMRKKLMSMFA
jgi:hypothetical protein